MSKILIVLRQIRRARKMSRKTLSELSGVSVSKIAHIENGIQSPRPNTLLKLSQSLNVEINDTFIVLKD